MLSYADDTQLYPLVIPDITSSRRKLVECLGDIKRRMAQSFFQQIENRTEVIIFGLSSSTAETSTQLGSLSASSIMMSGTLVSVLSHL